MSGKARAVTNEVGDMRFMSDYRVGEAVHGNSSEKYADVKFCYQKECRLIDLRSKSLRLVKIYEALVDLGLKADQVITLQDDSKKMGINRFKKDGTKYEPGRTFPSHYGVDVKINGKDIRAIIGLDVLKVGIKNEETYQFFRNIQHIKKLTR